MPMRSFIPNPVQAQQYKAGNKAQADELNKAYGLSFQPDSDQVTMRDGSVGSISDGQYIGVGEDGNLRVYDQDYFENRYTELNTSAVKQQAAK